MSRFFALLNRMKFINRWGLMRNTRQENVAEHSHMVSMIAHALATIENEVFGGKVDANKAGMMAVYHEASEVLTGDLPTPIKYFNPDIIKAYKSIEESTENRLIDMLPHETKTKIKELIQPDKNLYEYKLVKYADKIAAFIKCIEEMESGNLDFIEAKQTIEEELFSIENNAVKYFLDTFLEAYYKTLDENAKG